MRDEISQASLGIQNLRKIVEKLKEQNVYSRASLPNDISIIYQNFIFVLLSIKNCIFISL
jgi:hypothetical protein